MHNTIRYAILFIEQHHNNTAILSRQELRP
jgi:hypothetical protein